MSSPDLDYPRPEENQATFDRLTTADAEGGGGSSGGDKLAAWRALTAAEIVERMDGGFATPAWDPKWFVYHQDGTTATTAGPAPLAPWVKGVVVGSTKHEAAIFGISMGWPAWDSSQAPKRVRTAIRDDELAAELMAAYGISATAPPQTNADGLMAMQTDCGFSGLPFVVAETESGPPVSVYRFDQVDHLDGSPFRGHAYHSLDNAYFCRYPSVAGPDADVDGRATADRLSSAVLAFAHGRQPWEPYRSDHDTIMVFDGRSSGLAQSDQPSRWRRVLAGAGAEEEGRRARSQRRAAHRLLGLRHDSLP
jgi:hypothetical protein